MLTFLAAVIPIVGSLYAAVSYLVEQQHRAHERRVRERVARLVYAHYEQFRDEMMAAAKPRGPVDWDAIKAEKNRFETKLLAANGFKSGRITLGEDDLRRTMSGPLVPAVERRRQWVLLLSSATGLVLICVEVAQRGL